MVRKNILLQLRSLLIYAIIFALMLFMYNFLNNWMDESMKEFTLPIPIIIIAPIIMIFFGMLLSFERVLELIHETGEWRFNWARFLLIVIPLTLLSFCYALYYSQFLGRLFQMIIIRPAVITVAQVMQGSLFVSCFTKGTINEVEDEV